MDESAQQHFETARAWIKKNLECLPPDLVHTGDMRKVENIKGMTKVFPYVDIKKNQDDGDIDLKNDRLTLSLYEQRVTRVLGWFINDETFRGIPYKPKSQM